MFVYTYPSAKAVASVKAKVRTMTRGATNQPLAVLCYRMAPVLRGSANYFRHGVSKSTFDCISAFTWRRVICWLRHKHPQTNWNWFRRRDLPGWWPTDGELVLSGSTTVVSSRSPVVEVQLDNDASAGSAKCLREAEHLRRDDLANVHDVSGPRPIGRHEQIHNGEMPVAVTEYRS